MSLALTSAVTRYNASVPYLDIGSKPSNGLRAKRGCDTAVVMSHRPMPFSDGAGSVRIPSTLFGEGECCG
ncbi:hypothetical protein GCM10010987_76700 [Bradyrhizobium guangdongense]|uniref:Uncharacterized protein n=1 Tax=Bradyrhizobium guangdongense TaxID=1325090 RepID=A0AA87WBR7_9BRAD|nr:hypothetical protein GCM10010987_76700 [Bradyrhizobium guangdongense]